MDKAGRGGFEGLESISELSALITWKEELGELQRLE
jgi:hypothetical protein